jgi:uncharacterized protein (TIGR03000 family)
MYTLILASVVSAAYDGASYDCSRQLNGSHRLFARGNTGCYGPGRTLCFSCNGYRPCTGRSTCAGYSACTGQACSGYIMRSGQACAGSIAYAGQSCAGYNGCTGVSVPAVSPNPESLPNASLGIVTKSPVKLASAINPQERNTTARISVKLPNEAKLFVNGTSFESRVFRTPNLEPETPLYYVMKAELSRNGATRSQVRYVTVAAGDEIVVSFPDIE